MKRLPALAVISSLRAAFAGGGDSPRFRFIRGSFWLLASNILAQGLSIVPSMVTARLLGQHGFGELDMITNTVGTAGLLAGLGLGITTTKFIAQWKCSDKARAGRFVMTATVVAALSGTAMAALTFWQSSWIAGHMLNAPALAPLIRLASAAVFFQAMSTALMGILAGFEMFRAITRITTIQWLLNFPVMIAGAWYFGITGAVLARVVTAAIGAALTLHAVADGCARNNISPRLTRDRAILAAMFNFSMPAFIGSLLMTPVLWLAQTVLAHQPDGYNELGIINAANQWRIVLMTLPGIFAGAALPILTQQHTMQDKSPQFATTLDLSQRSAVLAVVPLYAAILFLGDIILRFYGSDFPAGYPVLAGLLFGISLAALLNVAGTAFAALGKMWLGLSLNLLWSAAFIGGVVLLAPRLGAEGYALSFAASYVIFFTATCLAIKNIILPATMRRIILSLLVVMLISATGLLLGPAGRMYAALPVLCASALIAIHLSGTESFLKACRWLRSSIGLSRLNGMTP